MLKSSTVALLAAVIMQVSSLSLADIHHPPIMGLPNGIIAPHPVGLPLPVGLRPIGIRPVGMPRPVGIVPVPGVIAPRPPIMGLPMIPQNYALNCNDFTGAAREISSVNLQARHIRHETYNVSGMVTFTDGTTYGIASEAFGDFRGFRVDLNLPGVGEINLHRKGDESPFFEGTMQLYGRSDSFGLQCQYQRVR